MAWCFEDEADPYSDWVLGQLRAGEAVVPAIWPLEVANVLVTAQRRGRLTLARSMEFGHLLLGLPITVDEIGLPMAMGPIARLGRDLGISAHDASYLELARRRDLPLATKDARLAAAAGAAGLLLQMTGGVEGLRPGTRSAERPEK